MTRSGIGGKCIIAGGGYLVELVRRGVALLLRIEFTPIK